MKTKEICLRGLMIALVTVSTMVLQIPVSATNGYIHLGDSMILLISVFFGWRYGMVAGGVGAALADLLSGYAHWAPFTLIIKGVMGLLFRCGHCMDDYWILLRRGCFAEELHSGADFHSGKYGTGRRRLCDLPGGRLCFL